ncbi:MAG: hypothetical protein FJY97_20145 [candidate division Zixibacteria bacterium]|nr:hypothetical protein [candidate division Zixibacteria bacterium]
MLLFVAALHPEARPLIAHFRLEQDIASRALPVYRRDDIALTVSGVGRLKSAIATTHLITRIATQDAAILNIGIAGSTQAENTGPVAIGDMFLIHRIVEAASEREFFPDMLMPTDLSETTCTTVDRPLDRVDGMNVADGLVDMEAAGFFQAAAVFLPPHRIGCIKIVSDFLEVRRFDKNWVGNLVQARMEDMDRVLNVYRHLTTLNADPLEAADHARLKTVRTTLRLTETQSLQLTEAARRYTLRHRTSLPDLSEFVQLRPTTRQEGKRHFDRLRQLLDTPPLLPPVY